MKDVYVRSSYVEDRKAGLPVSYLEFWFAMQERIDDQASQAFDGLRPANVEPEYDIIEVRGHWQAGNCDYVAVARLAADDTVELIAINFDIDPLRIDW